MRTNAQIRHSAREIMQNNWGTGALITLLYAILCVVTSYFSILSLFIVYPLQLGFYILFLNLIQNGKPLDVESLFSAFNKKFYWKSISVLLLSAIYTILWSLLLIIPGIIKSYSYRLAPYIIIENPELSSDMAIEKSMKMMKGHKMDLFLIDLGYTAWAIFGGILTLGIGLLWIAPYYNAVNAKFYMEVKDEYGLNSASFVEK